MENVAQEVLGGEILMIRAIPKWGTTRALRSIADLLGESAVFVSGRDVEESNQDSFRERIDSRVDAAIQRFGCAQLIFDDYGRAIRRSKGGTLHSMLYRLLVDSAAARDVGAIIVARPSDVLDLRFAGSPLLSRARAWVLPELLEVDAEEVGTEHDDLVLKFGPATWLARRCLAGSGRQGLVSAVEHLNIARREIVESLPPAAIEVMSGVRSISDCDVLVQEVMRCFGRADELDGFVPSAAVIQSRLFDEIRVQSPGWPGAWSESVARFVDLVSGVGDVIWVDRYLLSNIQRARMFLLEVRKHSDVNIRLLVSDDRERPEFGLEIRQFLGEIPGVSVRFMTRHDRRDLHDRHLVLPELRSGFVLPTAGVILGSDSPGSAMAVPMPALPLNYSDCWRRGVVVVSGRARAEAG